MAEESYDLVVVGAGPAGMSAAINARARDKSVAIFESGDLAAKIDWAPRINNYLGFSNIKGPDLAQNFIDHINDLEIPIIRQKVVKAYPMGDRVMLTTNQENYETKKLILTVGVLQDAKLEGEADYVGRGVSYCATCDGKLHEGEDVVVISDSAHHEGEANFLADICNSVYYLPQYEEVEDLDDRIEIIEGEVDKITGSDRVEEVVLDTASYEIDAVFILRETIPPSEVVPGLELEDGYVKVDKNMKTNLDGVYAAGDCVGGPLQIAKAVGEGQAAALAAVEEIE